MSALPVLPLWVTKYEGNTAHLTLEEDGAYTRLLRLCWRTPGCTVPADPAWVARHMRVDEATFLRAVKPILDEFFVVVDGRWQNLRLLAEYASTWAKTERRKAAGQKGGKAKALNSAKNPSSNATDLLDHSSGKPYPKPEPQVEKEEAKASSKKKATRLPDDWTLPAECRAWALEKLPPERVDAEGEKFADYWWARAGKEATKVDWPATWRTWIRKAAEDQTKFPQRSTSSAPDRKTEIFTGPDGVTMRRDLVTGAVQPMKPRVAA